MSRNTTLIARDGYGGNYTAAGADGDYMLAPGARLYVGPHGQPEESMGLGGVLDKIGGLLKGAGGGALSFYNQSQQTAGSERTLKEQQLAQQTGRGGGLPSWVIPVALVAGVGVLAMVLLKKKRKNPARRRRHRRARR